MSVLCLSALLLSSCHQIIDDTYRFFDGGLRGFRGTLDEPLLGKFKKMETKGCCSNKTYHIQADQDQQIQTSGFELTKPVSQFIFAFVFIYLTDHLADAASPTFTHYYPPLLLRDFPALFQTFRL